MRKETIDNLMVLNTIASEVGRRPFSVKELEIMTVMEFLEQMSCNGLRFHIAEKKKD